MTTMLSEIQKPRSALHCEFCQRYFDSDNDLDEHILVHFERKNCSSCDKLLVQIGSRWLHMAVECFNYSSKDLKVKMIETNIKQETEQSFNSELDDEGSEDEDSVYDKWITQKHVSLGKVESNGSNSSEGEGEESNQGEEEEEEEESLEEIEKETLNDIRKCTSNTRRKGPLPRLKCRICERVILKYNFESHLVKMHVPNILTKERVQCDVCDKSFANAGNLKIHRNIHKGVKRFVCDFCGKAFRQLFHLSEHLNAHTGNKPYHCTICEKRFGRAHILKSHKRIHTGEKPNICGIDGCDRAYAYTIDLKRHKFSVHGIYTKKHICSFCSKIFSENKLLKKHLESHSAGNIRRNPIPN